MPCRPLPMLASGLVLVASIVATPVQAQWLPNGVPLCRAMNGQDVPQITTDGAGGAIVVWRDERDFITSESDIYAQRITAAGTIAEGWPQDGIRVGPTTGSVFPFDLVADSDGGAYVVWGNGTDIFVQRITADGQVAPGWPVDGFPACAAPGFQWNPKLAPDGAGGVFVVWEDGVWFYNVDLFALRITPEGVLAQGWPVNGLPVCVAQGDQIVPGIAHDGQGGLLMTWADERAGAGHDVFGIRLTGDGLVASGWQPGGSPISTAPSHQSPFGNPVTDGEGGLILAWTDTRNQAPSNEADIYAQRMTGHGQVAPGWPVDGVALCTSRDLQWNAVMLSDGAGGAFVAWEDYRNYDQSAADVYAQRVLGNGAIAPGWAVNGVPLIRQPLWDTYIDLVEDGGGGAYAICHAGGGSDEKVIGQRVEASGAIAPGWEPLGRLLSAFQSTQILPRAAADAAGGMIVAWQEGRDLATDWDIYAQWVPGARPTASTPRISGTGLRRLVAWTLSEPAPGTTWAVLKSRNGGPPEVAAQVTAGASQEMSWEDVSPPGGVLAYRIRRESENPNYRAESGDATWPPHAKPLALSRPAGAGSAGELELSGASMGSVEVKVFDVQGRLVLERRAQVGGDGEAVHLDFSSDLKSRGAGIYFARAQDSSGRPTPPIKVVLLK